MDAELFKKRFHSKCDLCFDVSFSAPEEFGKHSFPDLGKPQKLSFEDYDRQLCGHLRNDHCTQEGGSFVCRYGENEVCSSLPVEGVNDEDYEKHIYRQHVFLRGKNYSRHKRQSSTMSSQSDQSDTEKWTVYSASQNLAAILNNPNKSKQKDFFTKLWGESFVEQTHIPDPSYLPIITRHHFELYLKKLSKKLRRRLKFKRRSSADGYQHVDLLPAFPSLKIQSFDKLAFDVPDIFMQTNFDLSNVENFRTVFPKASGIVKHNDSYSESQSSFNISSNSSKLHQEQLSHYLDVVEVQIAKQVSSKSDAFFHTMTSHDALMEQLSQTITKVRTLRSKIQNVDSNLVTDTLRILKGIRSRNNRCLVLHKLKIMATVYQTQPTVKLLLSTPDYVAALDLIYTTKDLLNNELAGVQCFRHLSSELNEMIKMIDSLMIGEFERYVSSDLNRPLLETETQIVEKDKFLCIIMGMLRRQCFSFVDCYWREAYSAIKTVIKQTVIEIVSESDFPSSRSSSKENGVDVLTLDEQLKLLTVEEWISLLRNTATSLTYLMNRIKNTYEVMIEAVKLCSTTVQNFQNEYYPKHNNYIVGNEIDAFLDEENQKIIRNKLSNLISSTCQYVSERYAHLLSKRSVTENNEKLRSKSASSNAFRESNIVNWLAEQGTLTQLKEVANFVKTLCDVCDKLCPNESVTTSLQTAFSTEATKFTKKFHEDRLKKLGMILENESWKRVQVPHEFQMLIDKMANEGKFTTYKVGDQPDSNKSSDVLCIGENKFVVVGTMLLLINMVSEYCIRAEDITLSSKCLLRYLTELLQLFNSKSYTLVVGGEAISEKTGMKKIISSNLALLMRSLQLILWLIPNIKRHFDNLLLTDYPQTITSLDRVSEELNLHITDITVKLLSIPLQMIVTELKNWEAKPPVPSKAFQNISMSLRKLYEAVSNILMTEDIHKLYKQINENFKRLLRERILKMKIKNDGGPQHGMVTIELIFYIQDLSKIGALPEEELNESSMNDVWGPD